MKTLLLLVFCLPLTLFGQDEKQPSLYELVNITAKSGQEEAFETAVKAHNSKYHADGPHEAQLAYNINGPTGGTYTWIMGPTTWTDMDNRPIKGAHDEDWKKVLALTEHTESPTYWTVNRKLTQVSSSLTNSKQLIWLYDIKTGQYDRFFELLAKVKEVYEKKRANETFMVCTNEFANTKMGQDAAIIFSFDKWSWLDEESMFSKDYEEVHGEGSFHNFLNALTDSVEGRIDWLREYVE